MKCDKLKSLKNIECAFNTTTNQEQVIAEDSEGNCYGIDSWEEVYLKDEVESAIDELKAKLESVQATAYAESVDRYLRKHINSWYNENCLTWAEACVAMAVKMCKCCK